MIFKDDLVEILGERPFPEKSIDGEESKSAEEKVTVDTDDKPSSEKKHKLLWGYSINFLGKRKLKKPKG